MLFDKGQLLNVPEIVPFRLTHNLVDGMGILGYEGKLMNNPFVVHDHSLRYRHVSKDM